MEDSPVEREDKSHTGKARGGWRAVKYIIGNESFEKLASMSLIANITVYLQNKYNISGVFLVNIVSIWSGSSNIVSIAGAFLSDAYLGRFWTLLLGSMASLLGMGTMTLTAYIPKLRPAKCVENSNCQKPLSWQLAVLFTGLGLLSLGAGGIRPCNIAFGADQFNTNTAKGKAQLETFFNWWYFSFTVALVIALTCVVYIQTNISWVIGFLIPTVCLALSITVFLIGRHTYILIKPQGSVFSDMFKVAVAACRKRNVKLNQGYECYDVVPDPEASSCVLLVHTDRFKFLDKAAVIVDQNELDEQGRPRNNWRLCNQQQVEHLKCLLSILPVWATGIACFMLMDQQNIFGILQAIQMNKLFGSKFKVPPGWMNLVSMIALSIWIFIYECLIMPLLKRITGKKKRLNMKARINIGIIMAILCMIVAGLIEKKRRASALRQNSFESPLSIVFLIPQFVLSGLTEAFTAVALMEFLTTRMPEDMRTVSGAIFFLSSSIASYISSAVVTLIHTLTSKDGNTPWLGGHDLNKNRLEYYYWIIGGFEALNLIYFCCFAGRYASESKAKNEVHAQKEDSCGTRNSYAKNVRDVSYSRSNLDEEMSLEMVEH